MTFETYITLLIQYTEDRRLVLSRQAEAWALFCSNHTVPETGDDLLLLGVDLNRTQQWPNF